MSRNTRYVVTGVHATLGHAPGEEFSAELSDEQEAQLVAGGAIARMVDIEPPKKPDSK